MKLANTIFGILILSSIFLLACEPQSNPDKSGSLPSTSSRQDAFDSFYRALDQHNYGGVMLRVHPQYVGEALKWVYSLELSGYGISVIQIKDLGCADTGPRSGCVMNVRYTIDDKEDQPILEFLDLVAWVNIDGEWLLLHRETIDVGPPSS